MINKDDFYRTQSKPTEFNDESFRSRLEAKWAVFFVASEIDYFYELEGVTLSNGVGYLPDFYLPDLETYVEIKPRKKTEFDKVISDLELLQVNSMSTKDYPKNPNTVLEQELLKMRLAYEVTKKSIVLLDNIPSNKPFLIYNGYWSLCNWSETPDGYVNISVSTNETIDYKKYQSQLNDSKSENITKFMQISNNAKFEHGETPTSEDIGLLRSLSDNKPKKDIKRDTLVDMLKKGQYLSARKKVYKMNMKPEYKDFSKIGLFYEYVIKNLNMYSFFELKENEPFNNFLDTNSSKATITLDGGIQYIEGSINNEYFKGTIIDTLKILLNKNEIQVINILKYILDVDLSAYNVYWKNKHHIKLLSQVIKDSPPDSPSRGLFKNLLDEVGTLLTSINTYVELDVDGNPHILYPFSMRSLTTELVEKGVDFSESKVHRFVNLCTLTKLITKLTDDDLDIFPILKQKLLSNQKKKHNKYRADVLIISLDEQNNNPYIVDEEPNNYVKKIALDYFQERGFISFNFLINELMNAYCFTEVEAQTILMSPELVEDLFLKHGFIIVTLDECYRDKYFISPPEKSSVIYVQNI